MPSYSDNLTLLGASIIDAKVAKVALVCGQTCCEDNIEILEAKLARAKTAHGVAVALVTSKQSEITSLETNLNTEDP